VATKPNPSSMTRAGRPDVYAHILPLQQLPARLTR
jgi:hypothetical protein